MFLNNASYFPMFHHNSDIKNPINCSNNSIPKSTVKNKSSKTHRATRHYTFQSRPRAHTPDLTESSRRRSERQHCIRTAVRCAGSGRMSKRARICFWNNAARESLGSSRGGAGRGMECAAAAARRNMPGRRRRRSRERRLTREADQLVYRLSCCAGAQRGDVVFEYALGPFGIAAGRWSFWGWMGGFNGVIGFF